MVTLPNVMLEYHAAECGKRWMLAFVFLLSKGMDVVDQAIRLQ